MRAVSRLRKLGIVLAGLAAVVAPALTAMAGAGRDANLTSAFGRLGLTADDMNIVFERSMDVTDPTLFRFAASLDPPSIDPSDEPWGVPSRIGATTAVWPDAGTTPIFPDSPEVLEGALLLPHGGPVPGTEYVVMWAQMGGPIPIDPATSLYQNVSFPFASPGSATWVPLPQFPYDTWGNASAIPYISYGPDPHSLSLSTVAGDGALLDQDFNGFGLIAGDTVIIAVDVGTLFPNGIENVTFGFASHIHDGGFGANPKSASLVAFATGDPGDLVGIPPASPLQVGSTPPPTSTTVTTTTLPTSTTSTPATSTTEIAPTVESPAPTAGFPWLPILLSALGIVVVVVGGRLYLANAKDPCAEHLIAWRDAEKACEEARETARKARKDCDKAFQRVADLEKLHSDLCATWPPACEGEGSVAERSDRQETRVTSRDLHARRIALGRLWDDYQAGRVSAREVEDAWRHADTPEFREEMRQKTSLKISQREKLENDMGKARKRRDDLCEGAARAEEAATIACDKAARANGKYDECVEGQNAETFLSAFMNLGAKPAEEPAPQPATATASPTDTQAPPVATPAQPEREVGVPVSFEIDRESLTGDELTRAEKLERIFRLRRGTGDLALVAKDLWQFNNWHIATFGEPWFTWSTQGGDPGSVTSTSGDTERFMQTRVMACYEFVHFCAYIAGDQLGRQRTAGEPGEETFLDEYSVDWGFTDEVNSNTSPLLGEAPSGSVITGSFRWGDYDNTAGYYHTGISIGDGKVISLGSDGLILEDATGKVDACFPSVGYTDVSYGDYAWGRTNPAPK